MKIKYKILIPMSLIILVTTVIFIFIDFRHHNDALLYGIDRKLEVSALLAKSMIPENYHDLISDKNSVSGDVYNGIVNRYNKTCRDLNLEYLWSLMIIDGKIVFTTATSPGKDVSRGDHASFFDVHSDPQAYEQAFSTMKITYRINKNQWGETRVVLIPFLDRNNRKYLFGASMKLSNIDEISKDFIIHIIIVTSGILIIGIFVSFFVAGSLSRPISDLSSAAEQISVDGIDRRRTVAIKGSHEVESLSKSIEAMNDSIKQKIDDLEEEIDVRKGAQQELSLKNMELEALNEELTAAMEELEATNEEFQTQNSALIESHTELHTSREEISKSLIEKNILLKEIHHRVKNNLQVITSLLDLQSVNIKDDYDRGLFLESQNRVHSMALIHEKLYQSENMSEINFREYLEDLSHELLNTYHGKIKTVTIVNDCVDVKLTIDYAIPCALIINELVSNSLKYAFPGDMRGEIRITLTGGDHFGLTVSDNGIGLPVGFDYKSTGTLGLQLVNSLTRQIRGEIKHENIGGTSFSITFKTDMI